MRDWQCFLGTSAVARVLDSFSRPSPAAVPSHSRPIFDPYDDEDDAEARASAEALEGEALGDEDEAAGGDEAPDDPSLDDDFPLGDGVADVTAVVWCPYCGEPNEVAVDPGGGSAQEYVEDCAVCCQPWRVTVAYGADGSAHVTAEAADV